MPRLIRVPRWPRRWLLWPRRSFLWIAAGVVLCLLFIWFPRPGDDDTLDYLQLGHNLLHYGIYGMGSGADLSPTTYRLPAYPVFLATFEFLFARFWPDISPIVRPNSLLRWLCSARLRPPTRELR